MRITVDLDDNLLTEAQHLTAIKDQTALINEGLRALIQRKSARRLAKLGGSEPQLESVVRRR